MTTFHHWGPSIDKDLAKALVGHVLFGEDGKAWGVCVAFWVDPEGYVIAEVDPSFTPGDLWERVL